MTATNETPSARLLLDYVADVQVVTIHDVATYFSVSPAEAEACIRKVGLVSPDNDGTYEIPGNGDPDDVLDAWLDQYGVDHPDTPLAEVPDAPQLAAPEPAADERPWTGEDSAKVLDAALDTELPAEEALARAFSEPKGDGTEIGDPDYDDEPTDDGACEMAEAMEAAVQAERIADLENEVASLKAEMAELRSMVEAFVSTKAPSKGGKKLNVNGMMKAGLIAVGDEVAIEDSDGEIVGKATLVSHREVEVDGGDVMRLNAWAEQVTGWKSVNVYQKVLHVPTACLFEELRTQAAEEG